MISITNIPVEMNNAQGDQQLSHDEILEDGEIDDDQEVLTEETLGDEEKTLHMDKGSESSMLQDQKLNALNNGNENEEDSEDTHTTRGHKKHQHRKRKKHRDSREKELKALEKKERRRKRKMHAHQDIFGSRENDESLSPHTRKRRKRKKHSREPKDGGSSTPENYRSGEDYDQQTIYKSNFDDAYSPDPSLYSSLKSPTYVKVSSRHDGDKNSYYTEPTGHTTDYQNNDASYDSYSESGSDFETQLAEYQNYKSNGSTVNGVNESVSTHSKKWRKQNTGSVRSRNSDRSSFEKESSRPHQNEMYEEFMDYEENPSRPCKFFAEGNCLKGDDCSFSHDQKITHSRRSRLKRLELCKYYLAGHCHHGDRCTYMHQEYPCKYFHTGATCYAADKCRFSHEPANEDTKEIIENLKDVLGGVDDSWEITELAKVGLKALDKPPPGVGLLPTPDIRPSVTANDLHIIPSIFDIDVEPTANLQKRIDENSVTSLSMCNALESSESKGVHFQTTSFYPPFQYQENPSNSSMSQGLPENSLITPMNQAGNDHASQYFQHDNSDINRPVNVEEISDKNSDGSERANNSANNEHSEDSEVKAPDFLPATQKALFMRIHHGRIQADSDKESKEKNMKNRESEGWTYSSDEDDGKINLPDSGIIKMDSIISQTSANVDPLPSPVDSILQMITSKQGGNSGVVDTELLSKVAKVIKTPTSAAPTEIYEPTSSITTYNPANTKSSPQHVSTSQSRERKISESSSMSPVNAAKPKSRFTRRRLSTQELLKEPVIIPLVSKQTENQSTNTAHPDPRITLSKLIGAKLSMYTANLPRFSKDLILPGSGKLIGLKITVSSDDNKSSKRDPRLGRYKDPRLRRSGDSKQKSHQGTARTTVHGTEDKSSIPAKPSALLTKSSTVIPSLPELDLNLAPLNNKMRTQDSHIPSQVSPIKDVRTQPNLRLPRLMKAPPTSSLKHSSPPSEGSDAAVPAIAPYDPRYMSSGAKTTGSERSINPAPYDPRHISGHPSANVGIDLKKRTIQLPKLTPAPSYQPSEMGQTDNYKSMEENSQHEG